jgi:hypothetical protein
MMSNRYGRFTKGEQLVVGLLTVIVVMALLNVVFILMDGPSMPHPTETRLAP